MRVKPVFNSVRPKSIEDYRRNFNNIKRFLDYPPQEVSLNEKRKLYKHFLEREMGNFTISKLAKWDVCGRL